MNAAEYNNFGAALERRGDFDGAVKAFRSAVKRGPRDAMFRANLGATYMFRGDLKNAARACRKAISLDPHLYRPYRDISLFRPGLISGHGVHNLHGLLEVPNTPAQDKVEIHATLGNVYEHRQEFDTAFKHFKAANDALNQLSEYDDAKDGAFADYIYEVFNENFLASMPGSGHPSPAPIFIVGMARSGTSLVEQILASHPEVNAGGERLFLPRLVRRLRDQGVARALKREHLDALGTSYIDEIAPMSKGKRFTDKLPWNFYYLGHINLALPNATIIHTTRDPLDTCVSCYTRLFNPDAGYSFDLQRLGEFYRFYEWLMDYWRAHLPGRILDVKYEKLIGDPESEIRRLLEFCGLPWDRACLDFHKTKRAVRTASVIQARLPIYATSIGRWRLYEKYLSPLVAALKTPA